MAILRTDGVARTEPFSLIGFSFWGGGGVDDDIVCDDVDCGKGGGGGRGSSMACVGLGFCCAAITSSAGLGPLSTSESLLCTGNSDIFATLV